MARDRSTVQATPNAVITRLAPTISAQLLRSTRWRRAQAITVSTQPLSKR
ncbi:MAG: hypothetical protein R2710_23710 [Acidimicrobiales bacterium]